MKLLNLFRPKRPQPTIDSYGQSTEIPAEQTQSIMEWLFASLLNAGYVGKSHFIWFDSDCSDPSLEEVIKKLIHRDEPIFLYRCGGRVMPTPDGYYWRMIKEHPSMRVYQLEIKKLE